MSPLPIQLFDSYLKQYFELKPDKTVKANTIKLYSCGPTVYNYQHIGNMRAAWLADTITCLGKVASWQVEWVLNTTDVGHLVGDGDGQNINDGQDKMELAAQKQNKKVQEIVDFYTNDYIRQCQSLGINLPSGEMMPKASDFIKEQMLLVFELLYNDYAYILEDGIYYDSESAKEFFANKKISDTLAKILEKQDQQYKGNDNNFTGRDIKNTTKSPNDFALWKFVQPNALQKWKFDQYIQPESSNYDDELKNSFDKLVQKNNQYSQKILDGRSLWGCPGWHSECVTMICSLLGTTNTSRNKFSFNNIVNQKEAVIDLHLGGEDHIDIHHKNEILQSEALGFTLSKYWVHNKFVLVDGKKMSKSLGNVYLVVGQKENTGFDSIEGRGYSPKAYRLMMMEHHYSNQMDFTWQKLEQSQTRLFNLRKESAKLLSLLKVRLPSFENKSLDMGNPLFAQMVDILRNDLNINKLLGFYSDKVIEVTKKLQADKISDLDDVFALLDMENRFLKLGLYMDTPSSILQLAKDRLQAKKDKNYQLSDELRSQILAQDWQIDDNAWGYSLWSKK